MRILLLTFSLAVAMAATAQNGTQEQAFRDQARQATEQLTAKLGLDKAQVDELDRVHFAYFREMGYIHTQMAPEARQARVDEMNSLREQTYRSVLTTDQYGRLQELRGE